MTDRAPEPNGDVLAGRVRALFTAWLLEAEDSTINVEDLDALIFDVPLDPPGRIVKLGVLAAGQLESQPAKAVAIATRLGGSGCVATRSLCAIIISQIGKYSPSIWTDFVKHLACDEVSEVRDFAANIFDSLPGREGWIEFHPDFVWETLESWSKDSEYLVRRLTTRALLGYVAAHGEITDRLLNLWLPLLNDTHEFVRRNLVSALRAVGKHQPEKVFDWLETNVAEANRLATEVAILALDSSFAAKLPERRAALLNRLPNLSKN